jgi:hypothetical protein
LLGLRVTIFRPEITNPPPVRDVIAAPFTEKHKPGLTPFRVVNIHGIGPHGHPVLESPAGKDVFLRQHILSDHPPALPNSHTSFSTGPNSVTSPGVYMARPWPMETIFLSILLEHEKMLDEILGKLKE